MDAPKTMLETRRFKVIERQVERPDGGFARCQFVEHPGAVVILPLVSPNQICLIHNVRLTVDKTLLELPAGTRESGETPLETAHRELAEETGYRAGRIEPIGAFFTSPGILTERMYAFVATDLRPGTPQLEDNEQIVPVVIELDRVLEMIDGGELEDGKSIAAILMWHRKRDPAG